MISRIGKYSFIINIVIALAALAGLIWMFASYSAVSFIFELSEMLNGRQVDFILIGAIPLLVTLLCHLTGFITALIRKKEPKNNTTAGIYKYYFYTVVILSVILFCVATLNNSTSSATYILVLVFVTVIYAPVMSIITATLVANAVKLWNGSKLSSVVFCGIALVLLSSVIGILQLFYMAEYDRGGYDSNYAAERAATDYDEGDSEDDPFPEPSFQETIVDINEYDHEGADYDELDGEEKADLALKYLYSKLDLKNETDPFSIIERWTFNGWRDNDPNSYRDDKTFHENHPSAYQADWYSEAKFDAAKRFFYKSYDDIYPIFYQPEERKRTLPPKVKALYDSYNHLLTARIASDVYYVRGLAHLVNILLISHDDLYGTEESPEIILQHILDIMNHDDAEAKIRIDSIKKEQNGYIIGSDYYILLKDYIPEKSYRKITYYEGDNFEYYNHALAVWAYSFWARRYNEGSDGVVFAILKHIKAKYEDPEHVDLADHEAE